MCEERKTLVQPVWAGQDTHTPDSDHTGPQAEKMTSSSKRAKPHAGKIQPAGWGSSMYPEPSNFSRSLGAGWGGGGPSQPQATEARSTLWRRGSFAPRPGLGAPLAREGPAAAGSPPPPAPATFLPFLAGRPAGHPPSSSSFLPSPARALWPRFASWHGLPALRTAAAAASSAGVPGRGAGARAAQGQRAP